MNFYGRKVKFVNPSEIIALNIHMLIMRVLHAAPV